MLKTPSRPWPHPEDRKHLQILLTHLGRTVTAAALKLRGIVVIPALNQATPASNHHDHFGAAFHP